jgi:hypothetical protein
LTERCKGIRSSNGKQCRQDGTKSGGILIDGFCIFHANQRGLLHLENEAITMLQHDEIECPDIIRKLGIPKQLFRAWIKKNEIEPDFNDILEYLRSGIEDIEIANKIGLNVRDTRKIIQKVKRWESLDD